MQQKNSGPLKRVSFRASLVSQIVKNLSAILEAQISFPGSGRSAGEGNGNPLQHSCLGNPLDREAWQARVHEVAKELHRTE